MRLERALERLRERRRESPALDRLAGRITATPLGRRLVDHGVARIASRSGRSAASAARSYETVFFIVGEMRSGTSWLRRMLAAHPDVACGHEGSFFGRGYDRETIPVYPAPVSSLIRSLSASSELRTWHALPWNQWSDGYEEDLRNLTRVSIDYFLGKEVARTGKRIVGDKSPQHTGCLDEIADVYPDAVVVHIVRDGRDVAVSALQHWWRLASDRDGGLFELSPEELQLRDSYEQDREAFLAAGRSIFAEERLAQLAGRWSERAGGAHRDGPRLFGDRYIELRYEDLSVDPRPRIVPVLSALGARLNASAVERCLHAASFERASSRPAGEEDTTSFFRKGVVGDWREVFTERDRELYAETAGDTLTTLGYEAAAARSRPT